MKRSYQVTLINYANKSFRKSQKLNSLTGKKGLFDKVISYKPTTDLDNQLGLTNYPGFREHRHDQSIFSLLTKKYGFIAFRDPSQFGTPFHELYPDSYYDEFIFQNRKRNYSHIRIKRYLRRKKMS